jgi:Ca2+/Na+ antiporter
MIAIDTLKLVLSIIVILMCIIPLNASVVKQHNAIILGLLFVTLFSLMFNDAALSLLLITVSVVFIYNVLNNNKVVKKIKEKMYQQHTLKSAPTTKADASKKPPIPPSPPASSSSSGPSNIDTLSEQNEVEITDSTNKLKRHFNNMDKRLSKMQSNVFDNINYSLFYNEMGDQHNIQGIETDISGFDINMFMDG